MGDDSEVSGGIRSRHRASLVERAAEKIAKESRTRKPVQQEEPAAATAVEEQDLSRQTEEPVLQAAVAAPVAPQVNGAGPAAGAPPSNDGRSDAANQGRSKVVTIDSAGLAARRMLTPEIRRNRTVEEFRLIKRTVLSRRWDEGDAPGNTILVTSALPSEGKTTTAINLAMSIAAEEDLRVLLVDADFIKPDALRKLGVNASKGLVDVLQNPRLDISDVMLRTNYEKLSLIPAGQLHDRCTELLASARMNELITELAHRYEDRILIFDSPPLLVTTESVVLASHMGQVAFVVQAGRTTRDTLNSALELIGNRPQLGLVLNRTRARMGNVEFGSYYGSYYNRYGYGAGREAEGKEA